MASCVPIHFNSCHYPLPKNNVPFFARPHRHQCKCNKEQFVPNNWADGDMTSITSAEQNSAPLVFFLHHSFPGWKACLWRCYHCSMHSTNFLVLTDSPNALYTVHHWSAIITFHPLDLVRNIYPPWDILDRRKQAPRQLGPRMRVRAVYTVSPTCCCTSLNMRGEFEREETREEG